MAQLSDGVGIRGEVRVYVFDGDLPPMTTAELAGFVDTRARDECADYYETANLVTNVGRERMTKLIVGESTVGFGYIGLTTSLTTPTVGLATLTNKIKRNPCSVKESISTYYQRYIAYFTASDFTSTGIAGAGGFDTVSTGGNMYAAASITLSKSAAQGAVVEWRIQATT